MKISKQTNGMTLIEAVVALAIFIIVVTLAVGGFVNIVRLQRKSTIMRETQQNARIAMEVMSKDIRDADSIDNSVSGKLTLTLPTNPPAKVEYYIDATTKVLMRRTTIDSVVSENPMSLSSSRNFEYQNLSFVKSGKILTFGFDVVTPAAITNPYDYDKTSMRTAVVMEGASL